MTQFTVVLKHLRRYRPGWEIDVRVGIGKHTALAGLCNRVWHDREGDPAGPYDQAVTLGWYENYCRFSDRPNSKVTNCLREVFGIDWDASLGRYEIHMPLWACQRAIDYLQHIGCKKGLSGCYNAVILHYQGNTSSEKKNLHLHEMMAICATIKECGRVPVILDWDRRSPLPDGKTIYNPGVGNNDIWGNIGTGDACMIAALIEHAEAFIGIDSGPGKVASATSTPSLICWRKHHPLQFHDPAPNTDHLIPEAWPDMSPLEGDRGMANFFRRHYSFGTYSNELDLSPDACWWLRTRLGCQTAATVIPANELELQHGFWCHKGSSDQDYVVIKDIFHDDAYKTRLIGVRSDREVVVDIGAHIGVFARLWHERNPQARIICVECCPENWPALHANVDEFATVIEAACTYEEGPLYLLNAIGAWGRSTGGSRVVDQKTLEASWEVQYWQDRRPMATMTLHEIMQQQGIEYIDILKMDCEGSEFSILEYGPLNRVGFIFMETHGAARWRELWARKFAGWDVGHMSASGDFENWHLRNLNYRRG